MNVEMLRKLFGGFLAVIAVYEIYFLVKEYRNKKKSQIFSKVIFVYISQKTESIFDLISKKTS